MFFWRPLFLSLWTVYMIIILFSRLSINITNQPSCVSDYYSSSCKIKTQYDTKQKNSAFAAHTRCLILTLRKKPDFRVLHWHISVLWNLSTGVQNMLWMGLLCPTPSSFVSLVFQVKVCLWALCAAGFRPGWPAISHLLFFSQRTQSFPGLFSFCPLFHLSSSP